MTDLAQRLDAARSMASAGNLPMRRTDATLYALLAQCKAICEDVLRDRAEDELRELYWKRRVTGIGRQRYIEKQTDAHIIVCRYVLDGNDTRNSTYRYGIALKEAAKRQIAAADLVQWLDDNGGVNALYKARETTTRARLVKTLHLTKAVYVHGDTPLSLTVQRRADGFFDVVAA